MVKCKRRWCAWASRFAGSQEGFGRVAVRGLGSLAIVFALLAAGCIDIRLRMGNKPDTDVLERALRPGESTSADVLAALGQPNGKGRVMLPIDPQPRTMWSYYYEEGDLQDARRIFLFVFFNQDRFDGYMWFSSLPR